MTREKDGKNWMNSVSLSQGFKMKEGEREREDLSATSCFLNFELENGMKTIPCIHFHNHQVLLLTFEKLHFLSFSSLPLIPFLSFP